MPTIGEEAKAYESKSSVKNITELPSIDTSITIYEENEVEHPYKYVELNGERYRVPVSVLANLKVIMEETPQLKTFKVIKTGKDMETRYTVIPLS